MKSVRGRRKKSYIFLLSFLLMMMVFVTGCGEKALEWSEETHDRTEEFGYTFDYSSTEKNGTEYGVDTKLNESVDKEVLVNQIAEEIKAIEKYTKVDVESLKIYIVESTVSGKVSLTKETRTLYIPYESFSDLTYQDELVYLITGLKSNWKTKGLSYLALEKNFDEERILDDFKSGKNTDVLYLAGSTFLSEWNTEGKIEIAENFAACLTEYALDKYGYEEFVSLSTTSLVKEYLVTLELNKVIDEEYCNLLQGYYFLEDDSYSVVAYGDKLSFAIPVCGQDIPDVFALNEFIVNTEKGNDLLLNYLDTNLNEMKDEVNRQIIPTIYLDASTTEWPYYSEDGIHVSQDGGLGFVFIELAYYYLDLGHELSEIDMESEGLARYLAFVLAQDYASDGSAKKRYYSIVRNGLLAEATPSENAYLDWYQRRYSEVQSYDEFDLLEVIDFLSYRINEYPEEFEGFRSSYPLKDYGYGGEHTHLTSNEAISFVAYLIDQYSFDALVKYLKTDSSFDECFGMTFKMSEKEWEEYLVYCE